ncbi:MAG: UTRA domain-containing protein, partial [Hyphomicrobiales bacterium]|nr:UTRA domain-containing protein [Hyphomicrobiales bacterium]
FDIPIIRHEIEQSDRAYRHVVLSRQKRRPPKIIAAKIGLPQHAPTLHVRSLHLADNQPYMLEDRWLNLLAVPEIAAADLGEISINEWLVRNAPFTHGQLDFHAKTATPDEAEWLETEAGAALFVATRATWNGAQPITYVTMIYPPGHRMVTNL